MHSTNMMLLNGTERCETFAPTERAWLSPEGSGSFAVDTQRGVLHLQGRYLEVRNVRARVTYRAGERDVALDLVCGAEVSYGRMEGSGERVELRLEAGPVRTTLSLTIAEAEPVFEIRVKVEAVSRPVQVQSIVLFEADFSDTFLAEHGREKCRFWRNWHDIWFPTGSMPLAGPEAASDVNRPLAYHFGGVYAPEERTALTFGYRMPNQ